MAVNPKGVQEVRKSSGRMNVLVNERKTRVLGVSTTGIALGVTSQGENDDESDEA